MSQKEWPVTGIKMGNEVGTRNSIQTGPSRNIEGPFQNKLKQCVPFTYQEKFPELFIDNGKEPPFYDCLTMLSLNGPRTTNNRLMFKTGSVSEELTLVKALICLRGFQLNVLSKDPHYKRVASPTFVTQSPLQRH